MGENALAVEIREGRGKGVARRLRAAKRIPAIFYGKGVTPVPLSLDPAALEKLMHGGSGLNTLIDLDAPGQAAVAGKVVIVRELQREPIRGDLMHADLFEVDLSQSIEVSVPVQLVGTARGVSLGGGILDHALREIEVECLPRSIPEHLEVDVSALEVGESVHVREVPLPEGVTLISDEDLAIVSVVLPASEVTPGEEDEEPEEGEAAPGQAEKGEKAEKDE